MEHVVSATEARVHFGEMMRRMVEGQEEIIVERSGKTQMVMCSHGFAFGKHKFLPAGLESCAGMRPK